MNSDLFLKLAAMCLILCPITATGQSPTEKWNVTFGGAGEEEGWDVLAVDDGYVITGAIAGDAEDSSVLLIKTDLNGTEIWNATFDPSDGGAGNAILETVYGDYVIAGYAQITDRSASILKAGKVVGVDEIDDYTDEAIFGEPELTVTSDDGYVLAVTIEKNSDSYLWLARMDSDWEEVWNETVEISKTGGYWVSETSDDGIVVADQNGVVRLIDTSGSEIWNSEIEGTASLGTEDGGNIVATIADSNGKQTLELVKTASDGTEAWKKVFDISEPADYEVNEDGTITIDRSGLYTASLVGDENVLIIKTDTDGNETENVTISLSKMEGYSVQKLADGGYLVADPGLARSGLAKIDPDGGEAWNAEFDFSAWDGSYEVLDLSDGGKLLIAPEGDDAVLAEVDSEGSEIWSADFDVSDWDGGYEVLLLKDGSHLLIAPECDKPHLVKMTPDGSAVWSVELDGTNWDNGYGFYEFGDGDYVIVTTAVSDPDQELLLMRVDSDGSEIWTKTFGEASSSEEGFDVEMASDGGYVAVGTSEVEGNRDLLLVKADSQGEEVWTKKFDRSLDDRGSSVQAIEDGGYIIVGTTKTEEDGSDLWLMKVDGNGEQIWEKTYGGTGDDEGFCVKETSDGGYILVGSREAFGGLGKNLWLLKTDADGNEVWNNRFGGVGDQVGRSVQETSDLGFIIAGYTDNGDVDALVIKTDTDGGLLWDMTLGGADRDLARAAIESGEGYTFTGFTESFGAGGTDLWLVRLS